MPVLVLLLASTLWGLTWMPLKFLHGEGIGGLTLLAVSCGVVSVLALPVLWWQRVRCRGQWGVLGLVALLGGFASFAFNYALMYGDVVRVMVLFYLVPVWAALGGRIWLGEHFDLQRVGSVVLALGGVFLILGGRQMLQASPVGWVDGLALAAGFAFAMNNVVFRATPAVPLVSKVIMMFAGCGLIGGAALLFTDIEPASDLQPLHWLWIVLMGVGWYLVAASGSQWAVTRLQAGQAGVIMVMELIAAVVSAVWLGESVLTPLKTAGVACVLAASVLEAWRPAEVAPQVS